MATGPGPIVLTVNLTITGTVRRSLPHGHGSCDHPTGSAAAFGGPTGTATAPKAPTGR